MNSNIIKYAFKAHADTNHMYDKIYPYSVHLAMTVSYAYKYLDIVPETLRLNVIDACWLHDTIEDARCTYNDIVKIAGVAVADMVYAVTNEKGKDRDGRANKNYYSGIRNCPGARFVKLCDRLANINYSSSNQSRMLTRYRSEYESFCLEIFRDLDHWEYAMYDSMIEEMKLMLNLD